MHDPAVPRIDSWKAIAHYLGRDVRTVMRWEHDSGLPVHRVPGSKRKRPVFAYADELDRWLASSMPQPVAAATPPARGAWRLRGVPGVALAAFSFVAAIVATVSLRADRAMPATQIRASGDQIVAQDIVGGVAWTFAHPEGHTFEAAGLGKLIDLPPAGDSNLLLAANAIDPLRPTLLQGELYFFTSRGELLWRRTMSESMLFDSRAFSGPWVTLSLDAVSIDGEPRIAWTTHDYTWWPSVLWLLDSKGVVTGRFVNAGWILDVNAMEGPTGSLVLAGGISNSRGSAMLAVLAGSGMSGRSPEEPGSPYACSQCPAGAPLRYLLFPRSEVALATGLPYNAVSAVEITDHLINVIVREGGDGSPAARIYELTREFELRQVRSADGYWIEHARLRNAGQIDHDEDSCTERESGSLRSWTPDRGWSEVFAALAR